MRSIVPWMASAFLVLVACHDGGEEWAGTVVVEEGVLRVENPVEPLAAAGEVCAHLLWNQTGPEEGDLWQVPFRLHAGGGTLYVVDRQASQIHRVTSGGDRMPSLGRPGRGPGEYRRIIDAIPSPVGLFVVDQSNGRVEILGQDGEILASHPLDRYVFLAEPLGPDAITLFAADRTGEGWIRMDREGAIRPQPFPDFLIPEGATMAVSAGSTWGERLVRLRYATPQVHVYSLDGALEREFVIPLPPEVATEAEVEEVVREVSSTLAQSGLESEVIQHQAELIRNRPREKFRFRRIKFDDARGLVGIWEQNPEDFGSGPATLHLLSTGGIYLARLTFDRSWADFDLAGGRLFVLSRDPATDLVALQAFELTFPDGLLEEAEGILEERAGGS